MANIDDGFRVERLSLDDLALVVSHAGDPTVGAGYEAPIGSLLLRTNGIVYRKTGTSDVDWKPVDGINAAEVFADMQDPTGYPTRATSQISFDDASRTFTIEPLLPATSFTYYITGVKYTISTTKTTVVPNASGVHYVYFDNTGELASTDTFDVSLLTTKGYTAAVYWNQAAEKATYVADERHGMQMDGSTHFNLHTSLGTQFISGLALSNIVADGNGDSNTHAQLDVGPGVIIDEDLRHSICNTGSAVDSFDLVQHLTPIAQLPVLYRLGANAVWHFKTADNFPLIYNGTAGYTGTLPPFNEFVGGAWQLTPVTNNNFVLIHLLATNDINHPVVALQGITQYPTKPSGRDAILAELGQYSGLPFEEFVPIASLIFECRTAYANTPKARIRLTDAGTDYVDWRALDTFSSTTGRGGITDHGNLSGLLDDDHPQYHTDARGDIRYYTKTQVDNLLINLALHRHNGAVTQTFSTLTTLLFGTSVRTDANYTYLNGDITVAAAGWYEITVDAAYTGTTNNRTISETVTRVNGVTVPGSYAYGYHRTIAEGLQTTTSTTRVLLAANDVITIAGRVFAGGGSIQTIAGACRLNIKNV